MISRNVLCTNNVISVQTTDPRLISPVITSDWMSKIRVIMRSTQSKVRLCQDVGDYNNVGWKVAEIFI